MSEATKLKPEPSSRKWVMIVLYWVVAACVVAGLLWQMSHYTKRPGMRHLNHLAKVIRKQYKPNDAIAFSPHWIGNYSLDRRRYKGTFGPKDLKTPKQLDGRQRAWIVYAFKSPKVIGVPEGYKQSSLKKVGSVYVQLVVKQK